MRINIYNWNCVLDEVLPELLKRGHTFVQQPEDADVVVLWNEIKHAGWLDIIKRGQKKGIPVILYQQGIWGIDRVQPPFNEKIHSDIVLVWGEGDKKRLENCGVDKKIIITGSPILRRLKSKVKHKGKNVVFVLEHWDYSEVPENMMVYSELRKLRGFNVIIKALAREHNLDLYENVVVSHRYDNNHLDICADLLAETDLVVAISESTFALMAEAMDIPVVIADIWMPKERAGEKIYLDYKHPFTKAVAKAKLEDLNETIKKHLKHPELLQKERKEMAIENGGLDKGNPVENIIKCIEDSAKLKNTQK